jgi:hypothetical protein
MGIKSVPFIKIPTRRIVMASKHPRKNEDNNRIEWFQEMYKQWKENNMPTDFYDVDGYFDDDDCDIDFTDSILH